ncbi:hypothetical protein C3432_14025 [Citrobacter amalonaticus]|uniref:Uncharacterized protein n=1 Tax=Citrobacter amalonaticus TaxID=35703 RepID=A0A2S4RWA9_CITAM|nr:hypothetical protein C3432_14025 [Citrobacter amalonaticus]POT75054.1 hypothetical protein C3436_14495 [Citrobacter amalonaticus]POU64583.1 hypothetical protein C3430_15515 [Citrobacter amalonaticus]POV04419.1 hypothetical protein C3424_14835 [Citrobacter amalonaticus]
MQTVPGFPVVIPYFFTTISTEKVNKIACHARYLFITCFLTVSYSIVIRYARCQHSGLPPVWSVKQSFIYKVYVEVVR